MRINDSSISAVMARSPSVAKAHNLGRHFARMVAKPMFRAWMKKRDKVSDESVDAHILNNYVQGHGGIGRVKALLDEFRAANESRD